MMTGFVRGGHNGESLEAQRQKLQQEGCSQIFEEKKDGGNLSQKSKVLEIILNAIKEGDILVVTRLDKLAYSLGDLAAIAKQLQEKGAQLKVLDQRIDTSTAGSDLAFNLIASLAEFDNDVRAFANKIPLGRKSELSEKDKQEIIRLYKEEGLHIEHLAEMYAVSSRTIYRILKRNFDTPSEPDACGENTASQPQAAEHNTFPRVYSSYG